MHDEIDNRNERFKNATRNQQPPVHSQPLKHAPPPDLDTPLSYRRTRYLNSEGDDPRQPLELAIVHCEFMDARARARELAAEYLANGDPTGWFEQLYREAEKGSARIPWADLTPNPNLTEFWIQHPIISAGRRALNIGCGLGDDAEQLAAWGFETTAFDISPSAIEACKRRFPATKVKYFAADLLNPPGQWLKSFDFVLESYTLQALPESVRGEALRRMASFVSDEGNLLLITRGRGEQDESRAMPWPLTRCELDSLTQAGLEEMSFEDYLDNESPPVRRFRVLYGKR